MNTDDVSIIDRVECEIIFNRELFLKRFKEKLRRLCMLKKGKHLTGNGSDVFNDELLS